MTNIELVLDIKNKINQSLNVADKQLDKWRNDAQRKLDSLRPPNMNRVNSGFATMNSNSMAVIDNLRSQVPVLDSSLSMVGNKAMIVGTGIMTLGAGLAYATKLSSEWEQGMAKVNVTAQLNREELTGLSNNLRKIGKDAPVDIMQIPEAFNTIISAGLDVKRSLEVLPLTLKASKAGFTDLKTTADAAVSVMNSSGRDVSTVYNVLFATMNKGKAEFQDIANYLPKIIPTSRALGISLEQTAGSWALLTAKGLKSEQATIGIQNLVKSLGDGKIVGNMKKAGINIFNKDGSLKDLTVVMDVFKSKLSGLNDRGRMNFMDSIGLDQEASMALNIMVQNVEDLKRTIGFVGNGADHLNKAFIDSATSTDLLVKIGNRFKYELMGAGDSVLEFIKPPLVWVYNHLDEITNFVKGIAIAVGVAGTAYMALKAPMLVINGIQMIMALTNPFMWIPLVIAGIGLLYMKFDWFRHGVAGAFEALKTGASIWWSGIKNMFGGFLDILGAVGSAIKALWNGDMDGLKIAVDEAGAGMKKMAKGAVDSSIVGIIANKDKIVGAYKTGYVNNVMQEAKDKANKAKGGNAVTDALANPNAPSGGGTDYNSPDKSRGKSMQDAVSNSSKSITINLQSLNSGDINVNVTELSKNTNAFELEQIFSEMFKRMLYNTEMNN